MNNNDMRRLTVRDPWAQAIMWAGKDVENRVRNIAGDYRGPVAIHAAKNVGRWNECEAALQAIHLVTGDDMRAQFLRGARGAIIGVVDLVDVHSASVIGGCGRLQHNCPDHETCRVHCSKWAMGPSVDGWYQHLVLANPRPLDEPIPYKGALGLRRLDADVAAQIAEAIA